MQDTITLVALTLGSVPDLPVKFIHEDEFLAGA